MTRWILQGVAYLLFFAPVWYLSTDPPYHYLAPDQAQFKIAFRMVGQLLEPCHQNTPEELAKLPRHKRTAMTCGRERSPLVMVLEMDGKTLHQASYDPGGLSKDLAAYIFEELSVPAGEHRVILRLDDATTTPEFTYVEEHPVVLDPGQAMIINFDESTKRFTLHKALTAETP